MSKELILVLLYGTGAIKLTEVNEVVRVGSVNTALKMVLYMMQKHF